MASKALSGPTKKFEDIKKINSDGEEYWLAREFAILLDYVDIRNFEKVIEKAQQSCKNSGQSVPDHFVEVNRMIETGKGAVREIVDWQLSRYACYLIAQNGDPSKRPIALAQTYFTLQTRKQEIFQSLGDAEKRFLIRQETKGENSKLFATAKGAGVRKFGVFNDAGYQGLYGMRLDSVEKVKGIKKGELLDRAGSTELAANLFRITQTEEKLRTTGVNTEKKAVDTHKMVGGKVRQTIKDIGGTLPEELPPERHIKEVEKDLKRLGSYDEVMKRVSRTPNPKVLSKGGRGKKAK